MVFIVWGSNNTLNGAYIYRTGSYQSNRTSGNVTCYAGRLNGTITSEVRADGAATFTGTVTANGTILTLASGNLDVGDRLKKADDALQALKTAAAASTDFTSLKAAIATALTNI